MSIQIIKAILLQELYITKRSLEVIIDLFYFSVINIVVFGFVFIFLSKDNPQAGRYLLLGMLLWEIIRVTQYSMSVGSLWNVWSKNLSNMFITPLSLREYIVAEMMAGVIKALLIFMFVAIISLLVFQFNVFSMGILNLSFFFINLTIFAWSVGIFILGLIFRYGTRIQAFAWGSIFIFQPLTAMFFPVSVLPNSLQTIAYLLPATYVFEAARESLTNPSIDFLNIGIAFGWNIFYFLLSLWFFNIMFSKSKDTGQFARMEG
ncbi:MAG: ABC transporter permease [Candidatus Levybacteria bacterium]|nr:ABC transporter permease [Candidatus Levybacteria bacterium]